jgi:hypothetical protein
VGAAHRLVRKEPPRGKTRESAFGVSRRAKPLPLTSPRRGAPCLLCPKAELDRNLFMQPLAPDLALKAPAIAGRFALIAAGLVALIVRAFLRDPRLAPLILPLCRRITRTARRFSAVMGLLAAGRLPRHAASRRGKTSDRGFSLKKPRERTCPIPTTRGWLVATLHHEAAAYRSQLAHLLAEPAVSDLLDAAPAARRLLRPICRMLGLSDTPPTGGVARLSDRHAPSRAESVLAPCLLPSRTESGAAPSPPPPALRPPPCPHLQGRWPWVLHPHAKPA